MSLKYVQKGNKTVKDSIVKYFVSAAEEFQVPVGILLGTCECESNFRLGLVSSSGAVGPMQLKMKFAEDFYRYANFEFNLRTWESIRGTAAILKYYAKKSKLPEPQCWQWALCAFRWGPNAEQMKDYSNSKRVRNVEEHMKRNGLWY